MLVSAAALLVISWTTVTLSVADDDGPLTMKSNAVIQLDDTSISLSADQAQISLGAAAGVSQLTQREISEVVDTHNRLRAKESASNMEHMTWSVFLANLAAGWSNECVWKHGNPPAGKNPPHKHVTQNLWASNGNSVNLTAAITGSWYNEKKHYDYDSGHCKKVCGHYTQVVWAASVQVGCAYRRCNPLKGLCDKRACMILVCNYGPPGNYVGAKPYKKGPTCSKCGSGAGWCTPQRLCNKECKSSGDQCLCAAHCHNCATLDLKTCRCNCADGWHGAYCTQPCKDKNKKCGRNPGWPSAASCSAKYVRKACLVMCKRCTPAAEGAELKKCDPVLGPHAESLSAPPHTTPALSITRFFVTLYVCVMLLLLPA